MQEAAHTKTRTMKTTGIRSTQKVSNCFFPGAHVSNSCIWLGRQTSNGSRVPKPWHSLAGACYWSLALLHSDWDLHWIADWQARGGVSWCRHWVLLRQTTRSSFPTAYASKGMLQVNLDLWWRPWTFWLQPRSGTHAQCTDSKNSRVSAHGSTWRARACNH